MTSSPDTPLAYFLTWTTYGSRLHGDARGSVERANRNPELMAYGTRPNLQAYEQSLLASSVMQLDSPRRELVMKTFREVADVRRWRIWALHVRTEHIHMVIEADAPPEKVTSDMKARATRLLREAELLAKDQPIWTKHGSTKYLWRFESLERAVHYTLYEQGEPMACFDGRGGPPSTAS